MSLKPLRVGLLVGIDPARDVRLAAIAADDRTIVVEVPRAGRGALRASRDLDVIVADGTEARSTARILKAAGHRTALLEDLPTEPAGAASAALAELAGRPGACSTGGPPVSVVATVRNEGFAVERLAADVNQQLGSDDEFVIVDGGSNDGTLERLASLAQEYPQLTVLEAPGTNISAGRNAGITKARHDVILTTDAGCHPAEGWLEALRAPFAAPNPPGLAAGNAAVAADTVFEVAQALACYPDPLETRRPDLLTRAYGKLFGTVFDPTLPFARSLAFSREAWDTAGGFPEDLGWTEDGVFGRNVGRTHRCVLATDAVVHWQQHLSVRQTFQMYHRYGRGAAASGDRQLVLRDAVRAGAYGAAAVGVALGGRRALGPLGVAGAAYLSIPLRRVLRHRAGWRVAACVPIAMAVKDIGKMAGAVSTTFRRDSSDGSPSGDLRRRVLFIVPAMRVGGAERHAALTLGALSPERFDRHLCCLGSAGPMAIGLDDDGIQVRALEASNPLSALRRLLIVLRELRPDVVMTFGLSADVLGRVAARMAAVPVVACWKHNIGHLGTFGDKERRFERASRFLVNRYFAVSNAQVDYLTDALRLDPAKIRVIRNAVDPTDYEASALDDASLADTLGLDDQRPVIIVVAALREEKDHSVLLRASEAVRGRLGPIDVLLVGDGPERHKLEQLASELGIADSVTFLGDRIDVPELLRVADLCVLPSFTIENAPYSVLEAMASGLPVVATDVGALSELVIDGETGRLVPPRDADALAEALIDVLGRPDHGRSFGAAGRRRVETHFDLRRSGARLEAELSEVLR